MKKKGSMLDFFFIIIVIFIVAITSVMAFVVFTPMNDEVQGSDANSQGKSIMQYLYDRFAGLIDGMFVFIFFMLFLGMIVTTIFTQINPAWYWISFILLLVLTVVTGLLGNMFYDFGTDAEVAPTLAKLTFIPFIMEHFLEICIPLCIIGMTLMYLRKSP